MVILHCTLTQAAQCSKSMLPGRKLFYTVRKRATNIKSKHQRKMFIEKKHKTATIWLNKGYNS